MEWSLRALKMDFLKGNTWSDRKGLGCAGTLCCIITLHFSPCNFYSIIIFRAVLTQMPTFLLEDYRSSRFVMFGKLQWQRQINVAEGDSQGQGSPSCCSDAQGVICGCHLHSVTYAQKKATIRCSPFLWMCSFNKQTTSSFNLWH